MTVKWPTSKLRDVADIRVSNVDKKSYATERPIKLCNYMDVYANDYVTSAVDFMPATASPSEIERFALYAGDVVITKDSETPDDIGVPAVIVEDIDGLVCGYHLALIRPKESVHPTFLAKQLTSGPTVKYFAANATGSTRFGLAIGAIERLEIPTPPIREQAKIAEVLSTVDRAIEQTEALIAKQQRIKTGLLQDLLTRGMDQHGRLRSEQTHEFKDSPLGRIPVEWACDRLGLHLTTIEQGWSPDCDGDPAPAGSWGVLKTTAVVWEGFQDFENKLLPSGLEPRPRFEVKPRDLLMTRGGPNSRVGVVAYVKTTQQKLMLSDKLYRLIYKPSAQPEFLAMTLASSWTQRHLSTLKTGLAESQTNISQAIVKDLLIRVPSPEEQEQIASVVRKLDWQLKQWRSCLEKLRAVKIGLMQDLLTGNRRVTSLLEQVDGATG